MRKKIAILALFLALVMVLPMALAACEPTGTTTSNEMIVWGPQAQKTMVEQMLASFKEENKDDEEISAITFKYNIVSEADASGKITTDVEAGADVYAFANDQLLVLLRAGALAKVGGSYETAVKTENSEAALESVSFNGGVYGYPYAADNGYFLYYNSTVLGASDVASFENMIAKLKETGRKIYIDIDNSWYAAGFFFGAGASYSATYDDKMQLSSVQCDFASKGQPAAEIMMRLVAEGVVLNGDDTVLSTGLENGSVVAAISGTWNGELVSNAYGEGYAATKLPEWTTDAQKYQMGSFAGFKVYGVNPKSDHLGVAHKLAAYLSGQAMQTKRFNDMAVMPTNLAAYEALEDKINANVALSGLGAQTLHSTAQGAVPGDFWTAVESFAADVAGGKVNEGNLQEKLTVMETTIKNSKE